MSTIASSAALLDSNARLIVELDALARLRPTDEPSLKRVRRMQAELESNLRQLAALVPPKARAAGFAAAAVAVAAAAAATAAGSTRFPDAAAPQALLPAQPGALLATSQRLGLGRDPPPEDDVPPPPQPREHAAATPRGGGKRGRPARGIKSPAEDSAAAAAPAAPQPSVTRVYLHRKCQRARRRPAPRLRPRPPRRRRVARRAQPPSGLVTLAQHGVPLDAISFFAEASIPDPDDPNHVHRVTILEPGQGLSFNIGTDAEGAKLMSYSVVHALYQLPDGRAFAEHTDLYDADDLQKFAAKRGCSASQLAPDGGLLENELVALAGRLCSPLNKTEADCFVLSKPLYDTYKAQGRLPADAYFVRGAFDPNTLRYVGLWAPPPPPDAGALGC